MMTEWNSFLGGIWEKEINVRDFIQKNYTPYDQDETFLAGPTQNTKDGSRYWLLQNRNAPKAVYWTWIPKSFPPLLPMALDTWIKKKKPL